MLPLTSNNSSVFTRLSGSRYRTLTPAQKNVVTPEIEPETSGVVVRNSDPSTTERSLPVGRIIIFGVRGVSFCGLCLGTCTVAVVCAPSKASDSVGRLRHPKNVRLY
jgi:hypothetical protein